MVMLSRVMPGDFILIACHLHEDSTAQIRDERLVVREPGNRANSLWSKPKTDAHRARGKRILGESSCQLDYADHACAIVVGLHGVTGVCLHKKLARLGIRSTFRVDDRSGDFESLLRIGDKFGFDDRVIFFVSW